MEWVSFLMDFVLRIDKHLETFVMAYGAWVYVLLFAIIFVETGLVVMPFLPGDSLLFVVGALAGVGLINYPLVMALIFVAAVLGDQTNYAIGDYFGKRVFAWKQSKFFNKKAFDSAHAYYEKHGGNTIVVARFIPFLRTFAPFVAGVAQMSRSKFTSFNILGAALWIGSLVSAGYLFGNLPWTKANLSAIIWAMILIPGLVFLFGVWKNSKAPATNQTKT